MIHPSSSHPSNILSKRKIITPHPNTTQKTTQNQKPNQTTTKTWDEENSHTTHPHKKQKSKKTALPTGKTVKKALF
jgi:hypothetical protein